MPLSEQEQRLLDEMERHLMQNDADVVSAHTGDRALSYRNLIYGTVLLLAGIGGLIAGVAVGGVGGIIIGVIAFAAMLGGLMLAFTPVRRTSGRGEGSGTKTKEPSPSFMDRMNDRWDRRHEDH
ncbi:DUF3040 domain-containing protein [Microbacterium panaciterrae]|uniref:DUF3040 domain-containing protein n=1 Tax=Microbacterium panaciterrae TaxID=985759 RepID=A0ABP8PK24_9MICO